jgi:hypothetical protein
MYGFCCRAFANARTQLLEAHVRCLKTQGSQSTTVRGIKTFIAWIAAIAHVFIHDGLKFDLADH